jgi:Na+/proline symporter
LGWIGRVPSFKLPALEGICSGNGFVGNSRKLAPFMTARFEFSLLLGGWLTLTVPSGVASEGWFAFNPGLIPDQIT